MTTCRPYSRFTLAAFSVVFVVATTVADDWPQWLGPSRDGVWRESGIVEKLSPAGPKILWRVPVNAGFSSPAVGRRIKVGRASRQPSERASASRVPAGASPGAGEALL